MTLKSDLQVHIHHVHTKDKVLVLYDRLGINLRNHFNIIIIIIIIGITGYEPGAGGDQLQQLDFLRSSELSVGATWIV